MITTKQNELHIINSFNDLMKDTKEKQKIDKLIRDISREYFTKLLYDDRKDIKKCDMLLDLSNHYNLHSYRIAQKVEQEIKDEYCYIEDYYDGSIDETGRQIAKKRYVYDDSKVGKDFGVDLVEDITNLVLEDYFKNLDKALEVYKFNSKVEKMKEQEEKNRLKTRYNEIDSYIAREIKETYNYYINKGEEKEDILYNFKYNTEVINSMFTRVIMKVDHDLGIKLQREDINSKLNKELKLFIKLKENEEDTDEDVKIPMGWKAFAITKFINKMFK